ncbi:E3 ubiquitin-protein ligase TRIM56 [Holothuria leucospilota]|uniref:E3 ubiquitin-protein ligase TRIM56 n=1 Tax=Holothuria leucospilota TaxID=206669 RepID=A0A9Q1H4W0_HOLLE|nr:E3 ubiquitin-protein ligase TRIM56 [Holothuria leucospilota]
MATNVDLIDGLSCVLQCKVCAKQLEDPIMLPCSHRLCRGCLPDLTRNGQERYCPNCRQKVELTDEEINQFKSDVLLMNIIECLKKSKPFKENDRSRACGLCSAQDIVAGYCFKCENYFCKTCCPDHNSNEKFRDHTNSTVNLSDEIFGKINIYKLTHSRRCKHHLENFLDEICMKCNDVPICITCRYGDHVGHKTKDIKTKGQENVDRVKEEMEALSEKMEKFYCRIGSARLLKEDVDRLASEREEEIKSLFTEGTKTVETDFKNTTETVEAMRSKISRGEMNHLGKEECEVKLSEINQALKKCREKCKIQLKRLWQKYSDDLSKNEADKKEKHKRLAHVMEHGWVTERRWRIVAAALSALIDWDNYWLMVTFLPDLSSAIKAINDDIDRKQESGDLEAIQDSFNSNVALK